MSPAPDNPSFSRLLADLAPGREDGGALVRETATIGFGPEVGGRLAHLSCEIGATTPSTAVAIFAATVSRYCGDTVTLRMTTRAMRACASGVRGASHTDSDHRTVTVSPYDVADDPSLAQGAAAVQQCVAQWVGEGEPADAITAAARASILLDVSGGLASETLEVHGAADPAELVCTLQWVDHTMHGSMAFDAARFDRGSIEALAMTFATLTEQASHAPQTALSRLPVLDQATRDRIVVQWNHTAVPRPTGALIHQLFERQVERTPDARAVEQEGVILSYRELNSRANHLALALLQREGATGTLGNTLVGVSMARSPELVIAILAILKAGGAFVPLDPDLPPERLTHVLSDTRARLLLTQPHLADRLRAAATMADAVLLPVLSLMDSRAALKRVNVEARGASEQAAYVIYTSGSTGQPKGVRIPHRALCNHAEWFTQAIALTPADRVLQYASISFDASMAEIFAPLAVGATVVLAAPYAHRDVLGLADVIRDERITVLQMVPSALRAALAGNALTALQSLRYLVVGGEALDRSLVFAVQDAMPGVRIGNFYGPSEACVDSTMIEIDASLLTRQTIPIGRPIANARCHILDRYLHPVPIGAPGELYIGGSGLAEGYHQQPELTAARFVPDPFRPGERLYRSGDRARYCPDGTMEYLGRIDTQVKLRGYRLELSEIEEALVRHPGVQAAAVIVRDDTAGEPTLVAYLVCAPTVLPPPTQALVSRLRQRLPAYAIPSAFGYLDTLPLTSNAKLDRRQLAQRPVPTGDTTLEDDLAPMDDPVERRLRSIWEQMLGVSPVGRDDDFFALGGHSIKAIRLLNEVEREFGIDIRAGVLFEAPTIRRFAERVRQRRPLLVSTMIPVQPRGRALPLFFVPGGAGELFVFEALARELGTDQPLHVMDLYAFGNGRDSDSEPVTTTVPDIAARMIADLRVVQPRGPYRLAGYSLGGNIAIEIAQQLRALNEDVSVLVLLDCDAPGYPHLQPFLPRTVTHIRHALTLGPREAFRYLRARTRKLRERMQAGPAPAHTLFDTEAELPLLPPNVIERMERALLPLIRAWESYVPQRYDGPVTLVRADVRTPMIGVADNDPLLGWTGILTTLRTDRIACGHLDILRGPQARRLAQILHAALAHADAR